jgi:hypothetical protein
MPVAAIDFETFYDSKAKYSLRNLAPYNYVMDERFDAYLVSVHGDNVHFVGAPSAFDWRKLEGYDIVAHNMAFDGLVLKRLIDLGRVPDFTRREFCTADLAAYMLMPRNLAGAVQQLYGVKLSKAVRTDMDGKTLGDTVKLGTYNDLIAYADGDAVWCHRIWVDHGDKWPEWEREASRLNREACWRGVRIDRKATEAGLKTLESLKERTACSLPWMENDPDGKAGSTAKLSDYLRSVGVEPPASYKKDGPEMMQLMTDLKRGTQFLDHVQRTGELPEKVSQRAWDKLTEQEKFERGYGEYRDIENPEEVLDVLNKRLDLASLNPHIARLKTMLACADENDILHFSLKYFGAHCLTGDHEVLTRKGWVRLDCWHGGEIMQWRPDKTMDFLPAEPFSEMNDEDRMFEISSPYYRALVTGGHTVPRLFYGSRKFGTLKASELAELKSGAYIPLCGVSTHGGSITEEQMRVLVAIQADGHYPKPGDNNEGQLWFTLRKPRKIERIQQLMKAAGVVFNPPQYFPSAPTQARIVVKKSNVPNWAGPERKVFGPWLLDSTPEARKAFAEELQLWDGNKLLSKTKTGVLNKNSEYGSTTPVNIEWARTIVHLVGKSTGIYHIYPAQGNRQEYHETTLRERTYTIAKAKPVLTGRLPVYCAITQTGFFLFRKEGIIGVTGNTGRNASGSDSSTSSIFNPLNLPKEPVFGLNLRNLLLPRDGYQFCIFDFGQIEARTILWLAGHKEMLDRISESSGNLYVAYGILIGKVRLDEVDTKEKLSKFKSGKLYAILKALALALGYGMGADKFRENTEKQSKGKLVFSEEEANTLVQEWRQANQPVCKFWRRLSDDFRRAALVGRMDFSIRMPSGRVKPYFDIAVKTVPRKFKNKETGEEETKLVQSLFAALTKGEKAWNLWGGDLAQAITQATARDIMTQGAVEVCHKHPNWLWDWSVYDEVIFEVPDAEVEEALVDIPRILCEGEVASTWARGLPLTVDGGSFDRYLKM